MNDLVKVFIDAFLYFISLVIDPTAFFLTLCNSFCKFFLVNIKSNDTSNATSFTRKKLV